MILNVLVLFLLLLELNLGEENYKGESFPVKYLQAEDVVPEYSDVEYYLRGLNNMLDYSLTYVNETDPNWAIGIFYMKAILKRASKENKNKIQKEQLQLINNATLKAEHIMSHYYYRIRSESWGSIEKRVIELIKDEDLQIEGIGNFNRNRLQKWILTNTSINDFAQVMDELKLQRLDYLKYTAESVDSEKYSMTLDASDFCLSEIIYNPKPLNNMQMFKPCVAEEFCSAVVYENIPSISYALSHRYLVDGSDFCQTTKKNIRSHGITNATIEIKPVETVGETPVYETTAVSPVTFDHPLKMLNVMLPRHVRRCYMRSITEDDQLMDRLCSSMYRETVYIARLGYFNRDMWMEHIAFCALLGYEEFHRRHWFYKVMSWIDDQGCIAENFNCQVNRTRIKIANAKDPREESYIRRIQHESLKNPCHWHQMALSLIVLAHGVRHAVHFSGRLKDEL